MNIIIRTLIFCFLLITNQSLLSKTVSFTEQDIAIANFITQIRSDLLDDDINGSVSFSIVKENKVILSKSFGPISRKHKIKTTKNTIYRIGSITKSITGFLLMQMEQKGLLHLDDPIEKHLPEIRQLINYDKYMPITFRHLASHTSGLEREPRSRAVNTGSVNGWELKVLEGIKLSSITAEPGAIYRYSNIGYAILGLAISRAAEESYINLVEAHIFKPLEMNSTFFIIPESLKSHLAEGIAGGPTSELNYTLPNSEHNGRGYRVPNGGLYSTSNDLAKFMIACMGYSNIIEQKGIKILLETQTPSTELRRNYSFGFQLGKYPDMLMVGHGGATPGYSAHFEFEAKNKYGIVILRNYNFGNTNLDLRSHSLLKKLSKF
ncbi:MAG: beta-lactamase family protein [Kangiellaceae bacterium]|nr:beta-lactamase family protein [Kangiellaceae bacterium]